MKVEHRYSDVRLCLATDEVEAVLYLYFGWVGWCEVIAWTTVMQPVHYDEMYLFVVVSQLCVYYPVSCHVVSSTKFGVQLSHMMMYWSLSSAVHTGLNPVLTR